MEEKVSILKLGGAVIALALAAGLPSNRTYISGIERGVRNPTVVILDKIAKALKVPAGRLLDDVRAVSRQP